MNIVTKERYGEMAAMAQELMQEAGKLRTTCKTSYSQAHWTNPMEPPNALYLSYTTVLNAPLDSDFEPYLARIDEISQQADMISNVASELDEYTKALGKLFEGKESWYILFNWRLTKCSTLYMIYRSAAQTCVQVIKKSYSGTSGLQQKGRGEKKDQCAVNFHRRHKYTRNDHLAKSSLRCFFSPQSSSSLSKFSTRFWHSFRTCPRINSKVALSPNCFVDPSGRTMTSMGRTSREVPRKKTKDHK